MAKRKYKGAYMLSRVAGPFDALVFASVGQGRLRTTEPGTRGRNPEPDKGTHD